MMDGLEAVEVKYTNLDFTKRIDSEFYRKLFLKYDTLMSKKECVPLDNLCSFLIGPFGSAFTVDNYIDEDKFRYIRGKDVKPFTIQNNDNVYMSEGDYSRLKKYALRKDDVLVSVVGTLGNCAIIKDENLPAVFSCKSTVIRTVSVNPYFIMTYLNTSIIKKSLLRKTRGAVQLGLNLEDLKSIPVVMFSNLFQELIENICESSSNMLKQAIDLYESSEKFLLEYLNIRPLKNTEKNISIKRFNSSFGISRRLDSEYYHPKYEEIESMIEKTPLGSSSIQEKFYENINRYLKNTETHKYIEIGDIDTYFGEATYSNVETDLLPANAKLYLEKNDILFSTVRPYRGAVAINHFNDDIVASNAFLVLSEKSDYLKECLFVLLRSRIYKEYVMKYNVGTSYPVVKKESILNMKIPNIDKTIQIHIADKIQQYFLMRKKSLKLLDYAKEAVEIAIEKDEKHAINFIKNKRDTTNV